MIAEALGWRLNRITEDIKPKIAEATVSASLRQPGVWRYSEQIATGKGGRSHFALKHIRRTRIIRFVLIEFSSPPSRFWRHTAIPEPPGRRQRHPATADGQAGRTCGSGRRLFLKSNRFAFGSRKTVEGAKSRSTITFPMPQDEVDPSARRAGVVRTAWALSRWLPADTEHWRGPSPSLPIRALRPVVACSLAVKTAIKPELGEQSDSHGIVERARTTASVETAECRQRY
jgi:hypothetical protein